MQAVKKLPARVRVSKIVSSRYNDNTRPLVWDERKSGQDVIETQDGLKIALQSDGGQSPPKAGWTILLRSGDANQGYDWTLYGM